MAKRNVINAIREWIKTCVCQRDGFTDTHMQKQFERITFFFIFRACNWIRYDFFSRFIWILLCVLLLFTVDLFYHTQFYVYNSI